MLTTVQQTTRVVDTEIFSLRQNWICRTDLTVIIDSKLSFEDHISEKVNKARDSGTS